VGAENAVRARLPGLSRSLSLEQRSGVALSFLYLALRPCAPVGPTLERSRGPGHRGRRTAPRGCCVAAPSVAAKSLLAGSGSPRRAEPGALGGSSGAFLRPARHLASMASGSRTTETDRRTPAAWTTGAVQRHCLPGSSPGQENPHLGIPADSRRADRHRSPVGAVDRVGHPAPVRSRTCTAAIRSDLVGVPQGAGDNHAGPPTSSPLTRCFSDPRSEHDGIATNGDPQRTYPRVSARRLTSLDLFSAPREPDGASLPSCGRDCVVGSGWPGTGPRRPRRPSCSAGARATAKLKCLLGKRRASGRFAKSALLAHQRQSKTARLAPVPRG